MVMVPFAESTILYAISGDFIGLANLLQPYHLSNDGGQYIPTKAEGIKSIKLKPNETVLQVCSCVVKDTLLIRLFSFGKSGA